MNTDRPPVEVPPELFEAFLAGVASLERAASKLATSDTEGRALVRQALPSVRKCTDLLERDLRAATDAARAEGYAAGVEAGRREILPPPLPAHHHLAHAVFAPLTGAAKTPAGQRVIVATAVGACLLIIAAGCVSAASVGLPLPDFFGGSGVP